MKKPNTLPPAPSPEELAAAHRVIALAILHSEVDAADGIDEDLGDLQDEAFVHELCSDYAGDVEDVVIALAKEYL
jgi:hypothetical protein